MIGFVLGALVVLVFGYLIAKHHWRVREPAAIVAQDSILPSFPHPHSMRYHDDGTMHTGVWVDDAREDDRGGDAHGDLGGDASDGGHGDAGGDFGGNAGGDSGGDSH